MNIFRKPGKNNLPWAYHWHRWQMGWMKCSKFIRDFIILFVTGLTVLGFRYLSIFYYKYRFCISYQVNTMFVNNFDSMKQNNDNNRITNRFQNIFVISECRPSYVVRRHHRMADNTGSLKRLPLCRHIVHCSTILRATKECTSVAHH